MYSTKLIFNFIFINLKTILQICKNKNVLKKINFKTWNTGNFAKFYIRF